MSKPFKEILVEAEAKDTITNGLNYMSKMCYGLSKDAGWWVDQDQGEVDMHVACTKLLLVVTEIAEATEGLRKSSMDDKLPHRSMLEVELGDSIIRIFDLAGRMGLDLGGATYEKLVYNQNRADHKPENRAASGGKKF